MLIALASDETNKEEMSLEANAFRLAEMRSDQLGQMRNPWQPCEWPPPKGTVILKYNNQRNDNQPNTYQNCWVRDYTLTLTLNPNP